MAVLSNGQQLSVGSLLGGGNTDSLGENLKFEQNEEASPNVPYFEAKGSDGKTYGFSVDSAIVTVAVSDEADIVTARERGEPLSKADAKKADERIKKVRERQEKVASGELSAQDAAKEAQAEQKEAQRERKEAREASKGSGMTKYEEEKGSKGKGR